MKTKILILLILAMAIAPTSATEIRGSVASISNSDFTWTANNFAAFYYDIDNDITNEVMSAHYTTSGIAEGRLTYTTTVATVDKTNHPKYKVVGWMGDRYVAVNDKANKIAKLIYDMKDEDKVTLTTGNVVSLGSGYTLTINEVDARASPRQAWVTFKKDGKILDDGVVGQKSTYTYRTTVLGEEDSLVFSIFTDSIFSGQTSDMIQLKYGWLIDQDTAKEIKTNDKFGTMEVTQATSDLIKLTNDNSISLSKDSENTFMGAMKFKVSKDGTRFYPKIDIGENVATIISQATVIPTSTPITKIVEKEVKVEVPVEKIVYKDREVVKEVLREVPTGVTPTNLILTGIITLVVGAVFGRYSKK